MQYNIRIKISNLSYYIVFCLGNGKKGGHLPLPVAPFGMEEGFTSPGERFMHADERIKQKI